jgi:hypothetical protein
MARRIPFEFVPSDVNTRSHPQVRQAGCLAELLFRRGNEHIKATHRDGVLYKFDLEVFGVGIDGDLKTHARRLVKVGLWEDQGEVWFVPGYLRVNHSQAEIAEAKDSKRLGAMLTNHRKGLHGSEPDPRCPKCQEEGAES